MKKEWNENDSEKWKYEGEENNNENENNNNNEMKMMKMTIIMNNGKWCDEKWNNERKWKIMKNVEKNNDK